MQTTTPTPTPTPTPVEALKGGDLIDFNGACVEVFDTAPLGYTTVHLRVIVAGQVKSYRVADGTVVPRHN